MDFLKNERAVQILKLLLMIIIVIIIFILIGRFTKNKNEVDPNVKYTTEKEREEKEKNVDTNSIYPELSDDTIKQININSEEILKLKDGNLNANELGTVYTEYDGYKNIFDQGIEVREIFGKALALKFSQKYTKNIIGGVKVSYNETEVISKIGEPNLKYENIFLYILDGVDVIFDFNEESRNHSKVQVYKNLSSNKDDYYKIINSYKKFLEEKNIKKYISNLTKEIPHYYRYEYEEENLILDYFDLGVRIKFGKDGLTNGLYLFDNFIKSENYNKEDIDNLKKDNLIYNEPRRLSIVEALYKKDQTKIMNEESEKIRDNINLIFNGGKTGELTEDVAVFYNMEGSDLNNKRYRNVIIKSKGNNFPTHYLNSAAYASNIVFAGNKIIYSVNADGIYIANIVGTKTNKIYEAEDNEKILFKNYDFEKEILTFNDKEIKIPK